MTPKTGLSSGRFFRLLLKGYVLGTVVSAFALHVTMAFIAPGDAGTGLALADVPIFFALLVIIGAVGLVVFPLAAIASWPFREMVFRRPVTALLCAAACGLVVGAIVNAVGFETGPKDLWSGPLVCFAYGVVWLLVVRLTRRPAQTTVA